MFDYDPEGFLIRRKSKGRSKAGARVGNLGHDGYWTTVINYRRYRTHRLIYVWHHGEAPKLIDHINRNRSDNRIENLRATTYRLNGLNNDATNVSWHSARNHWRAQVRDLNGKVHIRASVHKDVALAKANELRQQFYGHLIDS